MAADVACSPECTQWLVGMGCGREGGGRWTEMPVLDWMQLAVEAAALLLHHTAGYEQALLSLCCGPKHVSHVAAP